MNKGRKSSISMPPGDKALIAVPDDNKAIEVARQQLNVTPDMQKFFKAAGSQSGPLKKKRRNTRKSNTEMSFFSIGMPRELLEEIAKIIDKIPIPPGRVTPDFNKNDYLIEAVKNQIRRDKKRIQNGGKIYYTRA